jgi:putative ABC transport system permease protein
MEFAERAPIGLWNLAIAFGIAAIVAGVSVSRHTFAAMRIPPVLALRG